MNDTAHRVTLPSGFAFDGAAAAAHIMQPPRSTGGRQRLGRISKQGDVYIRRLLILGGTSLVRYARGAG
jgi:transposase